MSDAILKAKIAAGGALFTSAISAWGAYNTSQEEFKRAEIGYNYTKSLSLENLKVNQFIVGRNKINLLNSSINESISNQVQELQAIGSAKVKQARVGLVGGSAETALFDISRKAQQQETARINKLNSELEANRMQKFQSETQARTTIGLEPINTASSGLAIGGFIVDAAKTFGTLYKDID